MAPLEGVTENAANAAVAIRGRRFPSQKKTYLKRDNYLEKLRDRQMKIYGIDFTSRPQRSKPITCMGCELEGTHLQTRNQATRYGRAPAAQLEKTRQGMMTGRLRMHRSTFCWGRSGDDKS